MVYRYVRSDERIGDSEMRIESRVEVVEKILAISKNRIESTVVKVFVIGKVTVGVVVLMTKS